MPLTCRNCNTDVTSLVIHEHDDTSDLWCWPCHEATKSRTNQSAGVIPDSIPGGIMIKHGICNEDGTPRRYDSRSEIHREAFNRNLFIIGDTPKPNQRFLEERANAKEKSMATKTR